MAGKAFLLTWCLFIVHLSHSQDLAPKYSNEFLSLGVGAEAYGMGNAVVAQSNDVNSIYWNPAGLVGVEKWAEASFMHRIFCGYCEVRLFCFGSFYR